MEAKIYKSAWGWMPWAVILFTIMVCMWPLSFADGDDLWLGLLMAVVVAFEVVTFLSIYYKVVGEELWVYEFFRPTKLPIMKIAKITPSKSLLSSPAVSINRISITFADRSVLKSSMPLLISPKERAEFVAHLLSINPNIIVSGFDK